MRTTISALTLFALAACGDAAAPVNSQPPAIVQLLVADPDTGFWRGSPLTLSGLISGAVNADGDTVAAPAVTWTVPAGFTRVGDQLGAEREARGTLTATAGTLTANIAATAVSDLSTRTWRLDYRCYESTVHMRGIEDPPIGQDSIIRQYFDGSMAYKTSEWDDLRGEIAVSRRFIRFWKDKVVDTTTGNVVIQIIQDTATAQVYVPSVENLRMESDTPRVYRATWNQGHTTWCAGYATGSDFLLSEP